MTAFSQYHILFYSFAVKLLFVHACVNQRPDSVHHGLFVLFVGDSEPLVLCAKDRDPCAL